MALHGTLDTFGLTDVLQLLAATGKTGCLRVEGDGGQGTVWVRDGAVTAAATERVTGAPLDEVVCDLLRYESGSYAFEVDERAPEAEVPESLHDLLDRADQLLAEWRELQAVVPSLDHQVGLVEALAEGQEVTVTAGQWPALVAVGRGCTVGDLANSLGLTELRALRTVHDLVMSGLTTLDAGPGTRGEQYRRRAAHNRQ
jgi:hypothetical protein